jgi:hypothetical protein
MKKNVGGLDKIVRVVLGLALIAAGVSGMVPGWVALIGVVPLFTGAAGWCPLYGMIGINTCPMKDAADK